MVRNHNQVVESDWVKAGPYFVAEGYFFLTENLIKPGSMPMFSLVL